MYAYKILDHLPSLPQYLLDSVLKTLEAGKQSNDALYPLTRVKDITINSTNSAYTSRMLKINDQEVPTTYARRFELDIEVQNWIRENIVDDAWTECTISQTQVSIGSTHGAHTDKTREFVLMYVLDTGGEDCRTVWYQEKGQPYYRPGRLWLTVTDYDQLEERESIQLPPHCWSIINTQFLHGVENLTRDRIVIHVGLDSDKNIKGMISETK